MLSTLDPKNDLVFHQLFAHPRSKRCLIDLLTAVLRPRAPITDVTVLNPKIPLEQITNKGIVLDILVRLADGSLVDVEMQVQRRPGFPKRIIFYWARTYTSQLDRGAEYAELLPASVVVFTNFDETTSKRLHSTFRLLEVHDHQEFCGDLEIHLVELPNLVKAAEAELKAEASLARWSKFLSAKTDDDLAEAAKEDEMIEEAKEILEHMSADPRVQQMVRMREEGEFLYRVDLTEARKQGEAKGEAKGMAKGEAKGMAKGKAEGKAEGKREMILMLLDRAGVELTPEQRQEIEACDDIARLDQWIERALGGDDIELSF
jgi:predicted transposase/invertase (TIGR01784 family)